MLKVLMARTPSIFVSPRLVRVEPDCVLGAGGEVGRPVRVGQLPGLRRAQQVVAELRRALDERVRPRQVQLEDVLEPALRDPALVERDDAEAADVAAGGAQLRRVLGEDQVALRGVPAEDRGQAGAHREVAVEQRAVLRDLGEHRIADALHLAGQAVRDAGQRALRTGYRGRGGDRRIARGGHELHELGERGGLADDRSRSSRLPGAGAGARAGARAWRPRGRAACGRGRPVSGRLGLADLDEPTADREPIPGGRDEVAGRRDDVVRTAHVRGRGRQRPRDRDERVVREEVPQAIEAPRGRGEVRVEGVDRGPVDRQARCLDATGHRLEIGLQGAGVIEGGQVAECEERARGSHEKQEDQTDPREEQPPAAAASVSATSLGQGPAGRRGGIGDDGRIVAHGAGTAIATKRGAVG